MIDPHGALPRVVEGSKDVGPASALWDGGIDAAAFRDADNECRHERLPGDRTPPCGCWPQEPAPAPPEPEQEEPVPEQATPKRRYTRRAKPALTRKEAQELGPTLEKVVTEIDTEIARLQSARQALIDGARNGAS